MYNVVEDNHIYNLQSEAAALFPQQLGRIPVNPKFNFRELSPSFFFLNSFYPQAVKRPPSMKCDDEYKIKFSFGCVCFVCVPIYSNRTTDINRTDRTSIVSFCGRSPHVLSITSSCQFYSVLVSQQVKNQ